MSNIGNFCSKGSIDHELEAFTDEKMNVTLKCIKCNQEQFFEVGYQFDKIIKDQEKNNLHVL